MVRWFWNLVHLADGPALRGGLPVSKGRRNLGCEHPGRVGIRNRKFRVVDWNRPRRHSDLSHSAVTAAVMAQLDQPVCGSDDAVCSGGRRDVPAVAPGPSMAVLLAVSIPQHHELLAAVPESAGVGRVRGFDVLHDLVAVLVYRAYS